MNDILADRQLRDLIERLDSAVEALHDTRGLLDDGDPASVTTMTLDNIDTAIVALDVVGELPRRAARGAGGASAVSDR